MRWTTSVTAPHVCFELDNSEKQERNTRENQDLAYDMMMMMMMTTTTPMTMTMTMRMTMIMTKKTTTMMMMTMSFAHKTVDTPKPLQRLTFTEKTFTHRPIYTPAL